MDTTHRSREDLKLLSIALYWNALLNATRHPFHLQRLDTTVWLPAIRKSRPTCIIIYNYPPTNVISEFSIVE
jgi:hypothetical protein